MSGTSQFQRILVTGANGLLGQKVIQLFSRDSRFDVLATAKGETLLLDDVSCGYSSLDITDRKAVRELVKNFEPDAIINCAAMTHVDKCETEKEACWKINVDGVRHLAEISKALDIKLVHVSTDYVFDGKNGPYREDARVNPISYYGKSKLASENETLASGPDFLIFRTMVVYGLGTGTKSNFAIWLVQQLKDNKPVNIVTDQIGNSTLVEDLAEAIYHGVIKNVHGIYNAAGSDIGSRFDFAVKLAEVFGYNKKLISPVLTASLNQPAPRPLNSGLIILKAEAELGMKFSTTEEGLIRFRQQLKQAGLI
ncbi:MAG: dTDP-4-dehydrorhamnose reductase [Bacteroidetes bacterium]|nr:dTDP-4-dehydrorhamnose reductase [Bacteroidota bacterium]